MINQLSTIISMENGETIMPTDWVQMKCEKTYHDTLIGKWFDVRKKIWQTNDGKKYKIDNANFATEYVDPEDTNRDHNSTRKRTFADDQPQIAVLPSNKKISNRGSVVRKNIHRITPDVQNTHRNQYKAKDDEKAHDNDDDNDDDDNDDDDDDQSSGVEHGFGNV